MEFDVKIFLESIGNIAGEKKPRWAHVRDVQPVGKSSAKSFCRQYGVDPDEIVGNDKCVTCDLLTAELQKDD